MGIIAVMAMFIVPAFIACSWMFGPNLMQALAGSGPDRVKYTRAGGPIPTSAAPLEGKNATAKTGKTRTATKSTEVKEGNAKAPTDKDNKDPGGAAVDQSS
ncbi:MAG: hypothetical protein ACFBWO_08530 [Paracoccaceae bacterium]